MNNLDSENPFEVHNARDHDIDSIVETFIVTRAFEKLISNKNHVILGSRGSGKTTLAKMLSHDHLSKHFKATGHNDKIQYIGIYVPTRLEWVSGLKNKPWRNEKESELYFQWRLNVEVVLNFLITLRSCLDVYIKNELERVQAERKIISKLFELWFDEERNNPLYTIIELKSFIKEVVLKKQKQEAIIRAVGKTEKNSIQIGAIFDIELFSPLKNAIDIAEKHISFPEKKTWFLILDEAEFLEKQFIRIINSHMRGYSNIIFKITTIPYKHTLETNTEALLDEGHDFDYIYIDQGINGLFHKWDTKFAQDIFNKRTLNSKAIEKDMKLEELLGESELLSSKQSNWEKDSEIYTLFNKYASKVTKERAEKILSKGDMDAFSSNISRKIGGALILREAIESNIGGNKLTIYSGEKVVLRCGDTNPRRIIRIFNRMLSAKSSKKIPYVTIKRQNEILQSFSTSVLKRVQSEEECGTELYQILDTIGNYCNIKFHEELLSTDQISSIVFDDNLPKKIWPYIERAVGLGLLYPNINPNNPDYLPKFSGTFHLAYILSPHFELLPRRGSSRNLSTILTNEQIIEYSEHSEQYSLFKVEGSVDENY